MTSDKPTRMRRARHERDLEAAFAQRAPYSSMTPGQRAWDQGTRSFMCTRRADVLKVWVSCSSATARMAWRSSTSNFCALARLVHDEISAADDFQALHEPESNILCFRYVGDGRTLPTRSSTICNR